MSTSMTQKIVTHRVADFFERLSLRRDQEGLTQGELAQKSGVSTRSITDYERGIRTPTLENVEALATALNVTVAWLVGERGSVLTPAELAEEPYRLEPENYRVYSTRTLERMLPEIVQQMELGPKLEGM